MTSTNGRERRIASHPDDPEASLADRLLLALGMWPKYVNELGVEEVIDAAVIIRSQAHRYPMVAEDWGIERDAKDDLITAITELRADVQHKREEGESDLRFVLYRLDGIIEAAFYQSGGE